MKRRMAYCFLLNVLVYFTSVAQKQQQEIAPVSPEAAALAKMVNYPVNLNTGVPDISIPLYKVETGGMVLPITLQYHAGGFNINEHSTRTGLGWSLSCDLQITRSINGLDDFAAGGYFGNSLMKGHYPNDPNTSYPIGNSNWVESYKFSIGLGDGMPDKFHYKLLNKAGSFYFRKDYTGAGYTIVPVPFDNIRIEYSDGLFIITDTDGTVYNFGAPGYPFEGSLSPTYRETTGHETAGLWVIGWKCRSITNAANTETILFTYQDKAPEKYYLRSEAIEYYNDPNDPNPPNCGGDYYTAEDVSTVNPWINTYEGLSSTYPLYKLSYPKYIEHFPDRPSVYHLPFVKTINGVAVVEDHAYPYQTPVVTPAKVVRGISISKISFRGGSIEFEGVHQLTSIKIKNPDNSLLRSFDFEHTQNVSNVPNTKPTLYLDAIHVKNENNEVFERYYLLYKNKPFFGEGLLGKDAWGFPNAFTTSIDQYNTSQPTVPNEKITQGFYGCPTYYPNITFSIGNSVNTELADREGAQRGILKRIVYPTGGYVDFEFESNKFKEEGAGASLLVQMGAGLRIKTINYFDGKSTTPVTQKYYRYGEYEDGLGLSVNTPPKTFNSAGLKYNAYSYQKEIAYVMGYVGDETKTCNNKSCATIMAQETRTTYLPASSQTYTYPHGAQIYYTKVTEYNSDLGKETGKTVHIFYPPYQFTQVYPVKIPGTDIDYMRPDGLMGLQKLKEEYKYRNGRYHLVHSKEFLYSKYSQSPMIKVVYAYNPSEIIPLGRYDGQDQSLYDPTIPFVNGAMPIFITGQYGIEVAKLLLSSETEKWISDAGTLTQNTSYEYASNYMQPAAIVTTRSDGSTIRKNLKYCYDFSSQTVYGQMLAKNMIDQLIEEQVIATTGTVSTTKTNYDVFPDNLIAIKSIQKSYGSGPLTTEIQFDLYDSKGNLLQSTGKDGIVTSYLWGYQQKYVLAKITGLAYGPATAGISEGILQGMTDETQLRSFFSTYRADHPDVLVNSFTHKTLTGITSSTDPKGISRFFVYDGAGRLAVIKDHNQQIVQTYGYQMQNQLAAAAQNIFDFVPAQMESYNKTGPNNTWLIYNFTTPAGQYFFDEYGQNYQPEEKDGIEVADVPIDLYAKFDPYIISGFHLDLFKNGSLVYTKSFKFNADLSPVRIYVPRGEYQANLRVDQNFSNVILNNHFHSTAGANQTANSFLMNGPVTVNFVPGIIYSITSFDH